ncbi:MAG TPA: M15 family metallopeptidase [Xanthomonadaceae bacterium]|nr:M15 family metallopeptidase [Xanthomonadaceae bacterium]
MRALPARLINTEAIELWPARLLRARDNRAARALASADWGLRRKRDGRYLAAVRVGARQLQVTPLVPALDGEPGVETALALAADWEPRGGSGYGPVLPLAELAHLLQALGIDGEYGRRHGMTVVAEPATLQLAGRDRYRRPLWLRDRAARAWQRMRQAAESDGITLQAISGWRSHAYQYGIFRRKLARGQDMQQILGVNTAPGYSEHHGGDALDLGTPGEPPAEESFETTPAFAWLSRHAADFGFAMSYPRGNRHGIIYEPWHWRWHRAGSR